MATPHPSATVNATPADKSARRMTGGVRRAYLSSLPRPGWYRMRFGIGPVTKEAHDVDLTYSEADEEFRAEFRAWLDGNLPAEWRSPGSGRAKSEDEGFRAAARVGGATRPGRLRRHPVAQGVRRPGRHADAEGDLRRGDGARPRAADRQHARPDLPRADRHGDRHRGAEARDHRAAAAQRGHLVPGLLRARRRHPTSRAAARAPSPTATTTSSTARRSGPPTPCTPTRCSRLVRTDPARARSTAASRCCCSTCTSPGVEARPLKQMSGDAASSARCSSPTRACPTDQVLGEVGGGWGVAMLLLSFERGASAIGQYTEFRREVRRRSSDLGATRLGRGRATRCCGRQHRAVLIELECLKLHSLHVLTQVEQGEELGFEASMTKLQWSETHQDIGERLRRTSARRLDHPASPTRATTLDPTAAARAPVVALGDDLGRLARRSSATSSPSACSACPLAQEDVQCSSHSPTSSGRCRTTVRDYLADRFDLAAVRERLRRPRRRRQPGRAVEGRRRAGLARRH